MSQKDPSDDNVRGYDCRQCKIHFEAETTFGDAVEFDPDCPKCGDPTGFNCIPCFADTRNVGPEQIGVQRICLFPDSRHAGIVPIAARA